jgi:hypothetical protein
MVAKPEVTYVCVVEGLSCPIGIRNHLQERRVYSVRSFSTTLHCDAAWGTVKNNFIFYLR